MLALGAVILVALGVAPVPEFGDLERRSGLVEDARDETISPCRYSASDCLHTVVDIRHRDGVQSYNFAQTPVDDVRIGDEITLWVAPAIMGLPADRVWQAEQGGRVVREYERQARADRRLLWILVPLAPFLLAGGAWLVTHYDWSGNLVPR